MLRAPDWPTFHLFPVDAGVKLFIYQPHHAHIVPSYQVKSVLCGLRRLRIVLWSYYAFDRGGQHEVGGLVKGLEIANQSTGVDSQNQYTLCVAGQGL